MMDYLAPLVGEEDGGEGLPVPARTVTLPRRGEGAGAEDVEGWVALKTCGYRQEGIYYSSSASFLGLSVEEIKKDDKFGNPSAGTTLHQGPVGKCPECGADVIETEKAFGCSRWREGCKFAIWKNDTFITSLGKKVSYEMVKILLEHLGILG